jgi:MYXO-CTERM domain-containing protein
LAQSSAWTGLEPAPFPFWGSIPVKYYVNKATFPPNIAANAEQRLVAGFASWAAPSCTYFDTQLMGDLPGSTYDISDGKNVLMWINKPDPWPGELGLVDSVIGVTLPVWNTDGMGNKLIYDADIVFNNVGFCWYDYDPGNPGASCTGGSPVDTQSIATHEQGHFLGLGHTNAPGATMEPAYSGGNGTASPEQDDIDGVCALYPEGGTTVAAAVSCDPCRLSAANNECSSATKACTGPCLGLYNCIAACPTTDSNTYDTCATQCSEQFKDGLMTYTAYANCICNICSQECSTQCGGGNGPGGVGGAGGGWNEGGDGGEGPKLTDGGDCGCSVIGSDEHLGAMAALGLLFAALTRRRRTR